MTGLRLLMVSCIICGGGPVVSPLRADEGMWLINRPPAELLRERHGFEVTPAWLEHVQKASVRFNNGGSGSFVSPDGLIITNHHVGADAIQKLSSAGRNFVRDGFYARARADELKCVDLELNVLMEIEDVTARVNAAVKPEMPPAGAFAARRAAKAAIEQESFERTGLRSDVVTLFQGAEYHLYRYKRYTDVRLVFAPEQQAAFFGGDPDNFDFPRYCLDVAFFRAYEDGAPAKAGHYLSWDAKGAAGGDLVFVTGNPGSTRRQDTVAELEYERDVRLKNALALIYSTEVALGAYSSRGAENARRAKDDYFGYQNARKAYEGRLEGLLDPALLDARRREEEALQTFVRSRPDLADTRDAWAEIAGAQQTIASHALRHHLLEYHGFNSDLYRIARNLYRSPAERAKPNGDRLREFRDSAREEFELALFSGQPFYDDYEQLKIAHGLTFISQQLDADDPAVKAALAGKPPAARAAGLVTGTRVKDIAFRRELYAMTPEQMERVDDPLVGLVRALDGDARAARKIIEEQGEVKEQAHAKISRARYAKDGGDTYPDATFTLRLAFGTVKGYPKGGREVPAFTVLGGLYERSEENGGREPYDLPASWAAARPGLDPETPFNFVHTTDIIGGNSGSPTLNRRGEFTGIIFDGNPESLVWDYAFVDTAGRATSVDARAIIEALRKVYGADELAREVLTSPKPY